MKNLKLLSFQQFEAASGDCFCSDHDGNIYFSSTNSVFCMDKHSKAVSMCAEIMPDSVDSNAFIIGMEHIIETDNLFIASSSGEIYLFDIYSKEVLSVGLVDSGLLGCAWSPDQEFVVLLTGADSLILMTKEFDAITEKQLTTDEFGESKPITVGWGSKTTQFHGSEGKEAAHVKKMEPKPALAYDDGRPRISWRGDGEYFVTSSINSVKGYRQLRIWNREAVLQCTSEIKEGLEEAVCWKPSGNLIACSQQDADKHKIIFFEKNGLQHGEFSLPFKTNTNRVLTLSWNTDSNILLVIAEEISQSPEKFQVMLWTCSNYHWYLKQSFSVKNSASHKKLRSSWNLYHPMELFLYSPSSADFIHAKWAAAVSHDVNYMSSDDALVISVDNDNLLITPFGKMMVPPPLCAYSYNLSSEVQAVFFSPYTASFGCYLNNSTIAIFHRDSAAEIESLPEGCKLKLVAAGGNGFLSKVKPYSVCRFYRICLEKSDIHCPVLCHWTWIKNNKLLSVFSDKQKGQSNKSKIYEFDLCEQSIIPGQTIIGRSICDIEGSAIAMCSNSGGSVVALQLDNGTVLKYEIDAVKVSKSVFSPWLRDDGTILTLPQICPLMSIITICEKDFVLGLTERYSLFCNHVLLLSNCTSYYIHEEYLLTTTADHTLKCFMINYDILDMMKNPQQKIDVPMQKIEKGAKIVIAPLRSTKVVLQMPRGNLETIHPRPLVLSTICKYLDNLQYDKAFDLSKVHRIDLNILFDHNAKQFLENVKNVIEQLNSPNNLNLFLASLKNEDVRETLYSFAYRGRQKDPCVEMIKSKVNTLCDSFREVLEAVNDDKYYQTLIATYAKKTEPELDKALVRLKKLKDTSDQKSTQTLVDSALNFLLYLVDVNDLIDVALGTYDLEITIMVSQKSQKDPKEFLPFYNDLQKLEENYRKYKIDMHLQRYKLALQNISKCEDRFEECLSLIISQRLYVDALYLFPSSSEKFKIVWKEYGSYLMEKKYHDEAGLAFTRSEDYSSALSAYQAALNWQAMICAAVNLNYSNERITSLCLEMSEKLKSNQRYLDASYLLEHYVQDIEESIVTLIEGCEWNTALLVMSKHRRLDIAETHLKPALQEHHSYLSSYMTQLLNDFHTHVDRLKVLRSQKAQEAELPDTVKYNDDELFSENWQCLLTLASSCAESKTVFRCFKIKSIMTRKSSKSNRKQKLKKYRLKKGSPHEDLAHIAALSEIILKIDTLKDNFLNSLKVLVRFGFDKLAKELQKQMTSVVTAVESEMSFIWQPVDNVGVPPELKFGPDSTANSIAAALQTERQNNVSKPIDAELSPPQWRKMDLTLLMFR
ncbi:putative elongator complex protein 1 [Uloborus diversus]|uniref:putative elongator complex protein 1 n=1 Tax=Uloborus diversus TaxID=327109 RepID=UPI00240972F2|nr:putative elongator complex protein 1 [Uloborus diversus]